MAIISTMLIIRKQDPGEECFHFAEGDCKTITQCNKSERRSNRFSKVICICMIFLSSNDDNHGFDPFGFGSIFGQMDTFFSEMERAFEDMNKHFGEYACNKIMGLT